MYKRKMSKAFKFEFDDCFEFYTGTANDLLRVIKVLEADGIVSLFVGKPVMRTRRLYMLAVANGCYAVYREDREDRCTDPAGPWYAVLMDEEDNDWGTGSKSLDEAKAMAARMGAPLIAVIEDGPDPVCVRLINLEG